VASDRIPFQCRFDSTDARGGELKSIQLLGQRIDATTYAETTSIVLAWAQHRLSKYVCVSNVHMVMESWDNRNFQRLVNGADLVVADGMPLVWALRLYGVRTATRVYGPNLTWAVLSGAEKRGLAVGLYGGTTNSLQQFKQVLKQRFPNLQLACAIAPPFRPLTSQEDKAYTQQIIDSKVQILFVGIGCPKQEKWMAAHKGRLSMPMLGVGAAFDFHTGRVRQAPPFLQRCGLEWFFRLLMEPQRLWRRYLRHNPRFVCLFLHQWLCSIVRRCRPY
jgi:N-acetylglucosaminyldiphosphoundecaprenol N-acetyl-beta-D-mannosaminyltransferase